MSLKRMSLLALLGLVACLYWLFFRHSLFGAGPVTIAIQIAAVLLMIWARLTFGLRSFHAAANPTAGGLVKSGPYRYIRHPIYAAVLYFVWAGIAAHASFAAVLAGLFASALTGLRILAEEKLLVQRYPEYEQYSRTTPRVVPFVL